MRQFLPAVPTKQHSLPLPLCSLIQVAASIKVSYIRLSLVIGVFGGGHTCCVDALFLFCYFLTHFVILHHLLHSWWHGGVFILSPITMPAFKFQKKSEFTSEGRSHVIIVCLHFAWIVSHTHFSGNVIMVIINCIIMQKNERNSII